MPTIENGIHECYVCHQLLYRPAKISHRNNTDGTPSFRHLWHGSTNLLNETSFTHYAVSLKEARRRALMLLEDLTISEQTRLEERIILEELDRMESECKKRVKDFFEIVAATEHIGRCQ